MHIDNIEFSTRIVYQDARRGFHSPALRVNCGVRIFNSDFAGPASFDPWTRIGPDVKMGRYCSTGENVSIIRADVGSFCAFGNGTAINPFNHPTDWLSTHDFQYRDDSYDWVPEYRQMRRLKRTPDMLPRVKIGNDVWVGHGAVITGGVTIGHGAVIGAGAVVTKDVPSYAIVGGVPAKVIRFRFQQRIIDRLLALKWWDLPLEKLSGLPFKSITACLEILERDKCYRESELPATWPVDLASGVEFRRDYYHGAEIKEGAIGATEWLVEGAYQPCPHPHRNGYAAAACAAVRARNFIRPPVADQMLTEQL